ncbi:MAG: general secretion pathway protein GspK [Candidatus Omnitrophica bacterium]|nr:general secretion pathway protein GspK [Candidatus Omnitrophota bacterium]
MYGCLLANKNALKASVIILSLWMVALLSALSISLSYGIRQKAVLVRRLEEKRRASSLLEGAVIKAVSYLRKQIPQGYLGLNDNLINNPFDFKDMDFGDDFVSFAYNFFDDASGKILTFYGLTDEASKRNINRAEPLILKQFFMQLGLDEINADEIASSIVDWRDSDNLLCSPNSAEDTYYHFLEPFYEAKDSDFEILEELLLVRGMNKELFTKAKDYLTIYGDGKVNINTASKIVLVALGLNPALVDKIVNFRAGDDGISGTADDNIFFNLNEIVFRLKSKFDLTSLDILQLNSIIPKYLAVDSNFFRINCTVYKKEGKQKLNLTAVVNRKGRIFFWQEF